MNSDLNILKSWLDANKLSLNALNTIDVCLYPHATS